MFRAANKYATERDYLSLFEVYQYAKSDKLLV